jgi:hypothetical protein
MSYVGDDPWVETQPGVYQYEIPFLTEGVHTMEFPVSVSADLPAKELLAITNTIVITDSGIQGTDIDPTNNSDMDLDIVAGPDLAVIAFTVSPENLKVGEPLTLDVTIQNQGVDGLEVPNPDAAFFYVEVYAKDADYVPAGPPTGPLDHMGGIYDPPRPDNGNPNDDEWEVRYWYSTYYSPIGGLDPGEQIQVSFVIVPEYDSDYVFWTQADITFTSDDPDDPLWGHPWGIHREGNEMNNLRSWTPAGPTDVYLPLVLKH